MTRASAALLLVFAIACGGGEPPVVVGSKNFTEQRVLGELLAQTIEAAGMRVDRKLDLGGTFVCDAALRAGQIDVYVEYTGTALTAVLKAPPEGSAFEVLARVREAYGKDGLEWLAPLGFENKFALVVRPEAQARTISAAVELAPRWRAGYGYEFKSRADGAALLERVYQLRFAEVRTMDLGLLYPALTQREIDVAVGNSTDGLIAQLGLVVLRDDRHAFPPYEAVPIVRAAALDQHPTLQATLETLRGIIDADTMRRLNHAVDGERRSPADVVRTWRADRERTTTPPS
jgi:glycine betaine/choline ABC-type transport system substrate-binding protein